MKYILLCFFLFNFCASLKAQSELDEEIIQLQDKIENGHLSDSDLAQVHVDLSRISKFLYPDVAMASADKAVALYSKTKDYERAFSAKITKSTIFLTHGEYEKALNVLEEAKVLAEENQVENHKHRYLSSKGNVLSYMDKKEEGLELLIESLKYAGDKIPYVVHSWIGRTYAVMQNFEKAKIYYDRSLVELRKEKDHIDYLFTLVMLKDQYYNWGFKKESYTLLNEYIEYKRTKDSNYMINPENHCKWFNYENGFVKDSKNLADDISLLDEMGLPMLQYSLRRSLADIKLKEGKREEAYKLLNESKALAIDGGHLYLAMMVDQRLAKSYADANDYKNAFNHLENYLAFKDSTIQQTLLASTNELSVKYETEKNENEIALLKSEDKIKSLQITQASQTKNWLLFGLLGSFIAFSALAYLYLQNQKRKQELEFKNSIIEASLEEKNILLREIHHRVKNNLQVISSILNLQSHYISDDAALRAINEGKNRVSSMALIHQNLYQDDNVTSINAKEYFSDLISSLYDSYDISEGDIELSLEVEEMYIDVDTMVPLGLVVNELVSNALKHAFDQDQENKSLNVTLKNMDNAILLKVKDNGRGTTLEEFTSSKSFGNKLIQAFKQKLKANLKIINDNGTEISFEIKKYKLAA